AHRCRADAGAVEHGLPLDQLGGAPLAVPRASLGRLPPELEQEPPERPLPPRHRPLGAIRPSPERPPSAPPRRRLGLAAGPTLEQATERERGGLAGVQLPDQALCGRILDARVGEDVAPAPAVF